MQKIETPFLTVVTTVLAAVLAFVTACSGPLEAEYVDPFAESDDVADQSADGATDEEPAPVPEVVEPYVCVDADHDGFCALNVQGAVVDFNDSAADADGDGIVDGTKFSPGALETSCDGLDNDGDGQIDEDAPHEQKFVDADGDGYGAGDSVETCMTQGYADVDGDCNDADSATHPGAEDEPGDGLDTDCDDETVPVDSLPPQDERSYAALAELIVHLSRRDELELNYQLVGAVSDLGEWWEDVPEITVDGGSRIATEFSVSDRVGYVRVNVTIGAGADETWLCNGNGATAALLDGATATLEVGEGFRVGEPWLWSSPDGQGCSLVFPISLVN